MGADITRCFVVGRRKSNCCTACGSFLSDCPQTCQPDRPPRRAHIHTDKQTNQHLKIAWNEVPAPQCRSPSTQAAGRRQWPSPRCIDCCCRDWLDVPPRITSRAVHCPLHAGPYRSPPPPPRIRALPHCALLALLMLGGALECGVEQTVRSAQQAATSISCVL